MLQLSEYQNDRAAAALNVDPSAILARKSAAGRIMVYSLANTVAVGFGDTEALAVDALVADVARVKRDAAIATPCHSAHCRHYDLAGGRVCKVEAERNVARAEYVVEVERQRIAAHCNEHENGCVEELASTCSCDCVSCHAAEFGPLAARS
jgi:hypothetical protein